jgi:hypothetical protein
MVARHEMRGNVASRRRPVGYGMIGRRVRTIVLEDGQGLGATDQTVPCGTDHVWQFPRHSMPSYDHFVPPGQKFRSPKSVLIGSPIGRSSVRQPPERSRRSRRY